MRYDTRVSKRLITTAVACGLLVLGAAQAQGPGVLKAGTVSKVEIAVWDSETRDEIAELQLGDTLELEAGQSVILRLYAPKGHGPGDQRNYLAAKLYVQGGAGAELSAVDESKGSWQVTAAAKRGVAEIRYELPDGIEVTRPYMAKGSIKVEVAAPAVIASPEAPAEPAPEAIEMAKAEGIVERLYRGILLREPNLDKGKGQEWVEEIGKGGYPALVQVAREISDSEESQVKVAERGHDHRERLMAIENELLDFEPGKVDKYQMKDHLDMLEDGQITAVVMDIVYSPEFRRTHGYNQ